MDRPSRLRRIIGALELRCELLGDGAESMYLGADRIRLKLVNLLYLCVPSNSHDAALQFQWRGRPHTPTYSRRA